MPHPRQLLRHAIATQLSGKTSAGTRVYRSRVWPWERAELPALSVYSVGESVDTEEAAQTAPRELTRVMRVAIHGAVLADENVDDAIDDLALQVEKAIHADDSLGGTAADAILEATDVEVSIEGQRPVGHLSLTYAVTYRTYAPALSEGLDEFETADVRTNVGGTVHLDDEAHDVVSLPQE